MNTATLETQQQTLQECIPYPIEPDRINFKAVTAWAAVGTELHQRGLLSKVYGEAADIIRSPGFAQDNLDAALGRQVYDDLSSCSEGSPGAYLGGLRRAVVLHGVVNGYSNQIIMDELRVGVGAIVAQKKSIEKKFSTQYPTFRDLMARVFSEGWHDPDPGSVKEVRVPPLPVRKGVSPKPCEYSPDRFFERGAEQNEIAKICRTECPQVAECLEEALEKQIEWGVWGGMTERQRRAIKRKGSSIGAVLAQIRERSAS